MSEQKETAQATGTVEQSEDQIITRFGNSIVVMDKDSITISSDKIHISVETHIEN